MTSSHVRVALLTSSRWMTGAVTTWPALSVAVSSAGSAWKRSQTCTTWGKYFTQNPQILQNIPMQQILGGSILSGLSSVSVHLCWSWSFMAVQPFHISSHLALLPLSQSIRLYFLGEEAMEQEEENPLAAGNTCGRSCWNSTHCRHCYTCNDYRHPCICGKEGEAWYDLKRFYSWEDLFKPITVWDHSSDTWLSCM